MGFAPRGYPKNMAIRIWHEKSLAILSKIVKLESDRISYGLNVGAEISHFAPFLLEN